MTTEQLDTKQIKKLQEKYARAQHKLRQAEDALAAARIEGQQEVQRARLEAEKKLAEKRREVSRRAEKVARVEQALAEAGLPVVNLDGEGQEPAARQALTPEDTVEIVEEIQVQHGVDFPGQNPF